jgi:hypothetical protein
MGKAQREELLIEKPQVIHRYARRAAGRNDE